MFIIGSLNQYVCWYISLLSINTWSIVDRDSFDIQWTLVDTWSVVDWQSIEGFGGRRLLEIFVQKCQFSQRHLFVEGETKKMVFFFFFAFHKQMPLGKPIFFHTLYLKNKARTMYNTHKQTSMIQCKFRAVLAMFNFGQKSVTPFFRQTFKLLQQTTGGAENFVSLTDATGVPRCHCTGFWRSVGWETESSVWK